MTDFLFPDYPPYAVDDVAFTASVRSDDSGNVVVKVDDCFISKTFESFYFQAL